MSSGEIAAKPAAPSSGAPPARSAVPIWRRAIPYLGTAIIFALIFWRIPVGKVVEALRRVPAFEFIGIFLPFAVLIVHIVTRHDSHGDAAAIQRHLADFPYERTLEWSKEAGGPASAGVRVKRAQI